MVFEKETNLYQDAAIRSKFASQDTQFSVIQGKISYLITDSEIATYDDGKGTITSRMNSAENTVSEHSSTISSMQSEIDGVTGDVEEFHSTYNAFVQNTEGTFSQVSETLSTKTHVFRDQPAPPYNEGDFWIKDKELYVCVNSKEESESYSAADWIPSTKGRVFTTTPTIPYNAGDMWMQGASGDIKICTVTRTSGSYNAADWSNASRYIGNADLTTWYNNNLKDIITGLEDGEVSTYYQTADPSGNWTAAEKPKHEGDIWYNSTSTVQKYYRYNGSSWDEMKATPPDAIVQTVDKKANIYTGSSTPSSPKSGDLWFKGADQPILTYVNNSWQVYNKYTDDSAFTTFRDGTYATFVLDTGNALNTKTVTYYQASAPSTHNTGDLWIDTDDKNKLYRWNGTTWQNVQDAQIQDALTAAGDAQATADGKIMTYAQASAPSGDLDVGDLWIETDNNNRMYRWSGSSWVPYTDTYSLNDWLTNTYANDKSSLQGQIDSKVETFSQTSDPSSSWTTAEKAKHTGDLWYNSTSTVQKYYRYTGSSWTEIRSEPPSEMVTTINKKSSIFTGASVPTPPYKTGDLWFNSTADNSGNIYTCVSSRTSGSGVSSDWKIRHKYTDDSAFTGWQTTTYDSFINQLPGQINMQVTGSRTTAAGDVYTGKGDIILNINNTLQSEATISADKINLEAYSTATENEAMAKADYIGSVTPALNNYPASTWDKEKLAAHIGDTYYNKTAKKTYYFNGVPKKGLLVTFDSRSVTEAPSISGNPYDYVQFFYVMNGMLFETKKYCGVIGAAEVFIPSKEFWVYWHTDNSGQNFYGFSFSSLEIASSRSIDADVIPSSGLPAFPVVASQFFDIASPHNPYTANADKVWKYTYSSSLDTDMTFSWTQTEIAPLIDAKTSVVITSEGLLSKVSAGDIASTINQTAQSVLIQAQKIDLGGNVTVTGSQGVTSINGSIIQTGTLTADKIYSGILSSNNEKTYFDLTNNKIVISGYQVYTHNPVMTLDSARMSFTADATYSGDCYITATGGDSMYLKLVSPTIELTSGKISVDGTLEVMFNSRIKGGGSGMGEHSGYPVTCEADSRYTGGHIHFRYINNVLQYQVGTVGTWHTITST